MSINALFDLPVLLIVLYSESHCLYKINDFSLETYLVPRVIGTITLLKLINFPPKPAMTKEPNTHCKFWSLLNSALVLISYIALICGQFPRTGRRPRVTAALTPNRLTTHPAADANSVGTDTIRSPVATPP